MNKIEITIADNPMERVLNIDLREASGYSPFDWQKQFHSNLETKDIAIIKYSLMCGADKAFFMQALNELKTPKIGLDEMLITFILPTDFMAQQKFREFKSYFTTEKTNIDEKNRLIEMYDNKFVEFVSKDYIIDKISNNKMYKSYMYFIQYAGRLTDEELYKIFDICENIIYKFPYQSKIIVSTDVCKNLYFKKLFEMVEDNYTWFNMKIKTEDNPSMKFKYDEKINSKNGKIITYREELKRSLGKEFDEFHLGEFVKIKYALKDYLKKFTELNGNFCSCIKKKEFLKYIPQEYIIYNDENICIIKDFNYVIHWE